MGVSIVSGTVSGASNPIDELNANIAQLQADMQKNPQNKDLDEELLAIDQQELALQQQADQSFSSGDTSGKYDQYEQQMMVLEKQREEKTGHTLLESPEQLNNSLLSAMVAALREKDPHFAPMGTAEGMEALAGLQQIINQM